MASPLSADLEAMRQDGEIISYFLAANTMVYKGGMVAVNANGYLVPATSSANYNFVGVALEDGNNLTGAVQYFGVPVGNGLDGGLSIRVYKTGTFKFAVTSDAQTNVGTPMYVVDDNDLTPSSGSNSLLAGYVTDIVDATHVRIRIDLAVR
jgi:hypothetical protein